MVLYLLKAVSDQEPEAWTSITALYWVKNCRQIPIAKPKVRDYLEAKSIIEGLAIAAIANSAE